MYPKKSKDLIPQHAKDMDIPEDDVRDMVTGFWKALRKQASSMEHWNLMIRGIGHLRIRRKKVYRQFFQYLEQRTAFKSDKSSWEYVQATIKAKDLIKMIKSLRKEQERKAGAEIRKMLYRKKKWAKKHELEGKDKTGMGEQG